MGLGMESMGETSWREVGAPRRWLHSPWKTASVLGGLVVEEGPWEASHGRPTISACQCLETGITSVITSRTIVKSWCIGRSLRRLWLNVRGISGVAAGPEGGVSGAICTDRLWLRPERSEKVLVMFWLYREGNFVSTFRECRERAGFGV